MTNCSYGAASGIKVSLRMAAKAAAISDTRADPGLEAVLARAAVKRIERPAKRLLRVIQEFRERRLVSYGAHSAYTEAVASSVGIAMRPYIRIVGYRIHCEKNDTAKEAYAGAIENIELQDNLIFYILDQEQEYLRSSRRKPHKSC